MAKRTNWTDELIEKSIFDVVHGLNLNRMPTRVEVAKFYANEALTNRISKTLGFIGWAEKLSLKSVDSDTNTGKKYEIEAINILNSKGYTTERMTTGYSFDILVNGNIRVDVKAARPYSNIDLGIRRSHTFGISKRYGSCDLYLAIALNEQEEIEKLFVIPCHHLQQVSLSVGEKSKYDKYIDKWDYIDQYDNFYNTMN